MPTYGLGRPGVFLQENLVQQAIEVNSTSNATAAFIGALPKGPETPTYVTSWADFTKYFGGLDYNTPTTLAAYMFFANGGRNAYIRRVTKGNSSISNITSVTVSGTNLVTVVGTGFTVTAGSTIDVAGYGVSAVNGTQIVLSGASATSFTFKVPVGTTNGATTGGTITPSLKAAVTLTDGTNSLFTVVAKNSGTWANAVAVDVVGTASSFTFTVYGAPQGSTTPARSNVLEQFSDLSMTTTAANYFASIINQSSSYVSVTDLKYSPATVATNASLSTLAGGGAGSTITTTELGSTTWADFDTINVPLIFNLPDVSVTSTTWTTTNSATAVNSLISYAETRGDAFVIVDPHNDATVSSSLTYATSVTVGTGANAAMYFPWLTIPDTSKAVRGLTVNVAPGGAIAGIYQATDTSRGVFKTPAGFSTRLANVLGVATSLTNANLDDLNSAANPVNAIKPTPGNGIVVMGGRTLSTSKTNRYISVRRGLIYLKKELTDRTNFAVFENNDVILWNKINSAISNFLNIYWQQGGLRGNSPQEAFFVKCDSTTNSATDILNGRVNIQIGVALEYPAEFVLITIGQITGDASV